MTVLLEYLVYNVQLGTGDPPWGSGSQGKMSQLLYSVGVPSLYTILHILVICSYLTDIHYSHFIETVKIL